MSEPIINKVAESGLITLDPVKYLPDGEILFFDIKEYLFMGMILKEKDFRKAMKQKDWSEYAGKNVAVGCSADAIIPSWAYMLIAMYLQPVASEFLVGKIEDLQRKIILQKIESIDLSTYQDKRIVIKGCGDIKVEDFVYADLTQKLLPVVKSIMYGEPCSTVPVYKKK